VPFIRECSEQDESTEISEPLIPNQSKIVEDLGLSCFTLDSNSNFYEYYPEIWIKRVSAKIRNNLWIPCLGSIILALHLTSEPEVSSKNAILQSVLLSLTLYVLMFLGSTPFSYSIRFDISKREISAKPMFKFTILPRLNHKSVDRIVLVKSGFIGYLIITYIDRDGDDRKFIAQFERSQVREVSDDINKLLTKLKKNISDSKDQTIIGRSSSFRTAFSVNKDYYRFSSSKWSPLDDDPEDDTGGQLENYWSSDDDDDDDDDG